VLRRAQGRTPRLGFESSTSWREEQALLGLSWAMLSCGDRDLSGLVPARTGS
jgi:hypothetical protein